MTRCVCFQPDRLSCRIEKVSAKDGEMDGRSTNRPVRYHGRIGFTSHERELLFAGHHQPLKVWILCLYFLGLYLSNEQIAHELSVNESDVYQMTAQLRDGIVKKSQQ